MDQAIVGVAGVVIGGALATANALLGVKFKAQSDVEQKRQEALRTACADFSAALIRMRSRAWELKELVGTATDAEASEVRKHIVAARREGQVGYERVRMLSCSIDTQWAGRYALRHAWAIWQEAETGVDPRAAEYKGEAPGKRFNRELSAFYVESRRELGMHIPEDVMAELEH